MIDLRNDKGFTLPELLVGMTLMVLLIGIIFFAVQTIEVSGKTTQRQAIVAREISTPLHAMDKVLCQNKAILNSGSDVSDAYTLTVRSPVAYGTKDFTRHIYTVTTDGKLMETVYRHTLNATGATLLRTKVWSDSNVNRSKGPAFVYLGSDGLPTTPQTAASVTVELWASNDGQVFSGKRHVYFRNR
jgi:prepilin-type N-terminal cleavage/methylation domain-containing protein